VNRGGFTLIEVVVAIVILAIVVAAAFYFYGGAIDSHRRIGEKYAMLQATREFIDAFRSSDLRGIEETRRFRLEWEAYPMNAPARLMGGGIETRLRSGLQLRLVHLRVVQKEGDKSLLDLHFIVNADAPIQR